MKGKFARGPIAFKNFFFSMIHSLRMAHRQFTIVLTMTVMTFSALFNSINAAGDIRTSCIVNSDCSSDQYCYGLSHLCVDYTRCSRYNRQEGPTQSETPNHCGPCITGYVDELLATGARALICTKNLRQEDIIITDEDKVSMWIYIAAGIVLGVVVIGSLSCFFRNRVSDHGSEKWFKKMAGWNFTPTAPPPDTVSGVYHLQTSFFNDEEPPIYSSVMNNNTNSKDRNKLVSAVPFRAPDWIDLSQNYDLPDNSSNDSIVSAIHIEIEDEETNPSPWVPEQVPVQVPARVFHQFAPEQRDNVLNNVLVRGDCASNADPAHESNSPGPAGPGSNDSSRTTGETYRGPTVQINQMITLNMVNTDN